MKGYRFAAFVMTYERPELLMSTIVRLQNQSFPPEYILVIDNSNTSRTEDLVKNLNSEGIEYFRVGYNAGPAGAAKIGLQKLTEMAFDWIYWGDDDDPPRDQQVFQQLFEGIKKLTGKGMKLGIFGGKGGRLNPWTGRISSLSNAELQEGPYAEVDSVPGGQDMLVNSEVIKAGILPDEKLFFGFEEFDFCLRVKSAGYKVFIDAGNWLTTRQKAGLTAKHYRWRGHSFGNTENLLREFYSTRNLLEIFSRHGYYSAFTFFLVKSIGKIFLGFTHGLEYGRRMFWVQSTALIAFFKRDFSRRLKPD